jgi:hypothetical protein
MLPATYPTAIAFLDESGAIAHDRFFAVGCLTLEFLTAMAGARTPTRLIISVGCSVMSVSHSRFGRWAFAACVLSSYHYHHHTLVSR